MTIEFKIPNGIMRINADTFFQEATKAKIRKMLKCFKDSGPDPEVVQELKDWLQEKIDAERCRQKEFSVKFSEEKDQLPILDNYYKYLKTFCNNEEKVMGAKKDVRNCKIRIRTASTSMDKAEQMAERYKSILEVACKLLN